MTTRPTIIYSIAILCSLLLSLVSALQLTVINPDAICYLQSAKATAQGLHALMNVCDQARWPFYSLLIYAATKITHLDFLTSALILNSLFSVISLIAFMRIIQFFSHKPAMLWSGAIVFLLAHEFNVLRQDIIRDHGFWTFYLISIICLLNYFKTIKWPSALGWSISLIIATLFRIEGIFFLLVLPFSAFFNSKISFAARIKTFLQLNLLTLIGFMSLCVWMIFHPQQDLSRLQEVPQQALHIWQVVSNSLDTRAHLLAQYILTPLAERDSYLTLLLTFLSSYSIQVITNLSLLYAALVVYAWYSGALKADAQSRLVLWGYLIVSLIITTGFFLEYLFLSKRYLIALSLVLMIWVPFALYDLIYRLRQRKLALMLLLLLILLSSIGGIIRLGPSKLYVREAGDWLAKNVSAQTAIYSNDIQLMYYSQHFADNIFIKFKEFSTINAVPEKFDYLAFNIKKSNVELRKQLQENKNLTLIKTFMNNRGDAIVVYGRSKQETQR